MNFDVIVSGYSGLNAIIQVDDLPTVGKTQIVRNSDNNKSFVGGNGINIVYCLKKLGLNPLHPMRVGDDFESCGLKSFLDENGISDKGLHRVSGEICSICYLVENKNNEHMVLFHPGAANGEFAMKSYPKEYFEGVQYFIMSVAAAADNRALLKSAKENNIPLVFSMKYDPDAYPDDLLLEALSYAEIIFMNEAEEEIITKKFGIPSLEYFIKEQNAKEIIVTQGKKGCKVLVKQDNGSIKNNFVAETKTDKVVDTAGAGDSFAAGYIYGKLQGIDAVGCAELGNTMASFIIEEKGCISNVPNCEQLLERNSKR